VRANKNKYRYRLVQPVTTHANRKGHTDVLPADFHAPFLIRSRVDRVACAAAMSLEQQHPGGLMKNRRLVTGITATACLLIPIALLAQQPPAAPTAPTADAAIQPAGVPANPAADRSTTTSAGNPYPSDEDRLDGDTLKLRVNIRGFKEVGAPDTNQTTWCAPRGTKLKVTRELQDKLLVRFELDAGDKTKPDAPKFENTSKGAYEDCAKTGVVNEYTQYWIPRSALEQYAYRRSGVMFGALIVPFKFHLGSEYKLSASSTIAPYVGFRWFTVWGATVTPVLSAGLGLVPVTSASSGETETKSAFSAATGFVVTSTKNDKFNAGFLLGKDFLSKGEQGTDSTVDNLWISLYAGYKVQ
jgi:hypothetical protein